MIADAFDFEEGPVGDEESYHPMSGLAVVAFVLALLALAGWIADSLWFLALIGIVVATLALRRIAASDPPMLGRRLAQLALVVSLISAVGAPTNSYLYRQILDREAQQFAQHWFNLQLSGQTEKAWFFLVSSLPDEQKANLQKEQKGYEDRVEVQTLLALGSRAQVRYYDTEMQERDADKDMVTVKQNYAVTYDKDGKKTSFFFRLTLVREVPPGRNVLMWKVKDFAGGVVPKSRDTKSKS